MEGLRAMNIAKRLNLEIKEVRKMIMPVDQRGVDLVRRIVELNDIGIKTKDVAREVGLYRGTINRIILKHGLLKKGFISRDEKDWIDCQEIALDLGIGISPI